MSRTKIALRGDESDRGGDLKWVIRVLRPMS